jgi:thiamine-monophosphate kinase
MERKFIDWLRERLPPHPQVWIGPGDDAAVLRLVRGSDCVLTTDLVCDGVDFHLHEVGALRAGRKALAVNLSDLAAMAARPLAVVVALLLPRGQAREVAEGLCAGMLPLAEEFGVAICGGDVNMWDGRLAVSIAAVGETTPHGPLRRSGARPGDRIVVTGAFGGSILGKHLDFVPRVREALLLHERYPLHAGIDVSDGLSLDLWRLARESGVGAEIRLDAVPIAPDAERLARQSADGSTPLDHALSDGEDFELILAVPPDAARQMLAQQPLGVPLTDIGEFCTEPGLWQVDAQGHRTPLEPRGFEYE